ncbi:DUF3090 family protein [Dictyobacter arantiisoli]|uniref:DUF3090 family protein n=1 Tax=Dictyobacter arantiisoli TaxID=2014874 RepID=A0A5A5TDL1_9CHLR|nr:DUF3090 family protein [Dictyobacter arantiisoli]GCF09368.1 hypothetical protein KDI_29320 [Dictyobacter arantiisoli]
MSIDLGSVSLLGVEAVGQPGQRRFHLFLRGEGGSALLWMEKEQLAGLAEAIDHALALISEGQILRTEARAGALPAIEAMPADFPRYPTYDMQVGQMRLSFDEQDALLSLSIIPLDVLLENEQDLDEMMRSNDSLAFAFTQQQAQDLSISLQVVISAGRSVCPLCHAPLDGSPHACVKQNGHRQIIQIEESDDER